MNKVKEYTTPNGYTWYRLENNAYGSPRIMTHFLNLVSPHQQLEALHMSANGEAGSIDIMEQLAKEIVSGRNYQAKWFGGGIVWQSYLNDEQINNLIDGIQAN